MGYDYGLFGAMIQRSDGESALCTNPFQRRVSGRSGMSIQVTETLKNMGNKS